MSEDLRIVPVAHRDVKAMLEQVVADNWKAKALAKCLLEEMEGLHGEDRGYWLRSMLDEYKLLLEALELRFFAHPPLLAKVGLKIAEGADTKRLRRQKEQ